MYAHARTHSHTHARTHTRKHANMLCMFVLLSQRRLCWFRLPRGGWTYSKGRPFWRACLWCKVCQPSSRAVKGCLQACYSVYGRNDTLLHLTIRIAMQMSRFDPYRDTSYTDENDTTTIKQTCMYHVIKAIKRTFIFHVDKATADVT